MSLDLPPPTLVQDARGLSRLLDDLDGQHEIAVDTEADSFFSYREKVCLVQITVEDRDYLVDPLAGFDMRPLGHMLADPQKTKVFHDGEYDILILKRDFDFEFKNLFDTRVAAATLGSQNPGLASVLLEHFKVQLDKSMQRSNWGQRPLTDKQIRYARLDTHFLIDLMREQKAQLDARSRAMIVAGECLRLEQLVPPEPVFDPDGFARIKGARELGPLERQVLRELFILRERIARETDQPPFRIINNETLIALAKAQPRFPGDLSKVGGFSWKQSRKMGDDVVAAIARGVQLGPLRQVTEVKSKDGTSELSDEEIELHERLKNWRKTQAEKMGVDSAYMVNRHVLLRLSRARPRNAEALTRIDGLLEWQIQSFGPEILSVVERFESDVASGAFNPKKRRNRWRR
jgi:ribonuclease D